MYEINLFEKKDLKPRHQNSFQNLFEQLTDKPFVISLTELESVFDTPNQFHFVARQNDGELIGYACVIAMNLIQGTRYHIESVVVNQTQRQNGVGTSLILAILKHLKSASASHVNLTCNDKRSAAIRLYRQIGFSNPSTSVFRYHF